MIEASGGWGLFTIGVTGKDFRKLFILSLSFLGSGISLFSLYFLSSSIYREKMSEMAMTDVSNIFWMDILYLLSAVFTLIGSTLFIVFIAKSFKG